MSDTILKQGLVYKKRELCMSKTKRTNLYTYTLFIHKLVNAKRVKGGEAKFNYMYIKLYTYMYNKLASSKIECGLPYTKQRRF